MIANVESLEILLHVSFGRGFRWLSVSIDDPNYAESIQQGEKLSVAALKCFTVRSYSSLVYHANSPDRRPWTPVEQNS
jgi:hypothetical protein